MATALLIASARYAHLVTRQKHESGGDEDLMARAVKQARSEVTRKAILEAALQGFTRRGYDATTVRAVAREAGVDQALVHHYFGTKQELFGAAMEMAIDPRQMIETVLRGDRRKVGERAAKVIFDVWGKGENRHMIALIRSAVSHDDAARMLRAFLVREVIEPMAVGLGVSDAPLRASLAGSQVVGLIMARYILGFEPLASAAPPVLISALAPTIQRYLVGDIGTKDRSTARPNRAQSDGQSGRRARPARRRVGAGSGRS